MSSRPNYQTGMQTNMIEPPQQNYGANMSSNTGQYGNKSSAQPDYMIKNTN